MAKQRREKPRWAERDKWLSIEEMRMLLRHVEKADIVTKTLVHFMLGTGMRVSEVSKARFEDLRLDGPDPEIWTRGKGAKERIIPITSDLVAILRQYIAFRKSDKPYKGKWGYKLNGNGYLFPWHPKTIWLRWRNAVRAAGLNRGFHTHAARHSYASIAYQVNEDLKTVQDLMGHSNSSTTSLYVHSTAEMRRATVEGMSEMLSGK